EAFAAELAARLGARPGAPPTPARKGDVSVYVGGQWYGLTLPPGGGSGAIASLDADRLHRHVLAPLLGLKAIRTGKRIDFVGGIRGTAELERLVDSGKAAVAFSLYPVSLDELMAVSDAGEIMPPKSTWFEPKLRDGLLIHTI